MSFCGPEHDEYWRLTETTYKTKNELRGLLELGGYDLKQSLSKDELFKLYQRMELGGICYDNCSLVQLKRFAMDRGLLSPRRKPTKRWLADTLLEADKDRTFSKLADLPPEIRKIVYEFHIFDFQHRVLEMPTQPPIARTCRFLRNEVLPVFYSTCTFHIEFKSINLNRSPYSLFRMDDKTYIFLATLAQGCIGDLRRIELTFVDERDLVWCWGHFKIDLTATGEICRLDVYDQSYPVDYEARACGREVKHGVEEVLEKVSKREGGKKFRMEDFYALGRAAEDASKRVEK